MGLLALVGLIGPSWVCEGYRWSINVAASYLLDMATVIGFTALYRQ